jgi:L,D-transpeptidase ErfK/SrfK
MGLKPCARLTLVKPRSVPSHYNHLMSRFLIITSFFACLFFSGETRAATYQIDGDVIGEVKHYTVRKEDNLYAIARRFDIGIVELLAANPGVDPWTPKPGTDLTLTTSHVLPAVRHGIVLNLSELRLFYFADSSQVMSFPIGIGREGWETPIGQTSVVMKRKNPSWIPPESIREENPNLPDIVPAGPNNPLGQYALSLGLPGYAIHGTNRPYGVGKRSSHGCIRLYPEDIEVLFNEVSTGTPVTVIDTAYKLGWQGETLFLEVTPTQEQADIIAKYRRPFALNIPEVYAAIKKVAGNEVEVDWKIVDTVAAQHSGIPTAIGEKRHSLWR